MLVWWMAACFFNYIYIRTLSNPFNTGYDWRIRTAWRKICLLPLKDSCTFLPDSYPAKSQVFYFLLIFFINGCWFWFKWHVHLNGCWWKSNLFLSVFFSFVSTGWFVFSSYSIFILNLTVQSDLLSVYLNEGFNLLCSAWLSDCFQVFLCLLIRFLMIATFNYSCFLHKNIQNSLFVHK